MFDCGSNDALIYLTLRDILEREAPDDSVAVGAHFATLADYVIDYALVLDDYLHFEEEPVIPWQIQVLASIARDRHNHARKYS